MMRKKVVLINPVKIRDSYSTLALGPLTIGTILKENKFDISIIDFNYLWEKKILNKEKSIKEILEDMADYILAKDPAVVGFSTISTCHHVAVEVSKLLKERNAGLKVFFGGHQASLTAVQTLESFNWIDLIAIGESELNIVSIVDALLNNKPLFNIKGIAYRDAGKVLKTQEIELLDDLDKIPLLDYDLVNLDIDLDSNKLITFPIEVGRSCPFSCTFCCTKTFWKQKFRMKSTARLIDEIEYIMGRYGVANFHFLHDLFTFKKDLVMDFCSELKKRNIQIRWICSARVDTINEDMIQAMYEAGCRRIFLGIESASPVIQKLIRKNINVDSIIEKVKIIRKYGIKVEAGFMYGFPGENKEHVNVSLNLMLLGAANNLWFPEIGMLNVENGTELYDELKEQLYIDDDVDNLYFFSDNEFKYFYKMYKEHPDLFPHFYDFRNETRQRYKYLDKFMWVLTSMILLGYKSSINAIVSYYNMDVLKIYEDLLEFHGDEFKAIFVENLNLAAGNDKKLIESRCQLLTNFLNTFCAFHNGREVEIIAELFDLDKNVVNLRIFGKVNEIVKVTYSYNLIKIRMTGEIADKGNYTFQLEKVNSTKVKIECNN